MGDSEMQYRIVGMVDVKKDQLDTIQHNWFGDNTVMDDKMVQYGWNCECLKKQSRKLQATLVRNCDPLTDGGEV